MASRTKSIRKFLWTTVGVLAVVVIVLGFLIYRQLFTPNIFTGRHNLQFVFIPTGSDFNDVLNILDNQHLLINEKSFVWVAKQMKYPENIRPGRYPLKPKMNNKDLVTLLRSGKQTPVKLIFNSVRTKDQLAQIIGEQIEARPSALLNLMNDPDYTSKIGFTPDNILALFLPNTYEFYWNTSADQFIRKMKKENDKYWNASRINLARQIGLTTVEISVLASIVQQESNREDEKPVIAGVYMNRYKKGVKLEADPTLVYALGDFTVNRVLNVYKSIDSPYNTYLYKGLPPGPICLPTTASITAVLNYSRHKYMYFCARDDFSGYHNFAVSYETQMENARKFRRAMDKRGIRS